MEEPNPTPGPSLNPDPDRTVTFKRSHLYAVLLPLAFVLGLSVGYLFWGRSPVPVTSARSAAAEAAPADQGQVAESDQPQQVKRYDVPVDDDPILGPDNAAITIIEFSDYQCPYCRQWHSEVFSRLMETYPTQVRFVYRDFPLTSIHPEAQSAAEAADCANEQGAFWDFHDKLFSAQDGLGDDAYIKYANDLGLDMTTFKQCIDSGQYKDEVQSDLQYAANLGVRSTPTFFINGIPLVGAQPFEVFKEVIDKELAGEIP